MSAVKPFNSTPDQNPINSLQISNTIDNIPITIEEPLQILETVDPFQFIDDINIDDLLKNSYCSCHDSCKNAPATFNNTEKLTNNHLQVITKVDKSTSTNSITLDVIVSKKEIESVLTSGINFGVNLYLNEDN